MTVQQAVVLAIQASILLTVFGFGLQATVDDVLYLVRRPGLLARSMLAMFVIMPIVALTLAIQFQFRESVEIALVALAISPVPPLLPKKESKAGGDSAYALGLMVTAGVLSIAIVPVALQIVGYVIGAPMRMHPMAVASVILKTIVLPIVAGMLVRALLPRIAMSLQRIVRLIVMALFPLAVLALLAGTYGAVWALVGDGTVIAIVAFVVAGLAVGHFLGGPDPHHSTVLALSSACRHPALALSIAAANYPEQHFAGAIILSLLVSTIVTAGYVFWRRRGPRVTVAA